MRIFYRNLCFLFTVLLFGALGSVVLAQSQPDSLVGTWRCSDCWIIEPTSGSAIWQLKSDGSYLLTVRSNDKTDKTVWKEIGTWSADDTKLIRNNKSVQEDNKKPTPTGIDGISFKYSLSADENTITFKNSNHSLVFNRQDKKVIKNKPVSRGKILAEDETDNPPRKLETPNYAPKPGTIYSAADKGDIAKLQRLIAKGASVKAKDAHGKTALHYAVMGGSLEAIKLLVGKKSDINAKNFNGETPLKVAKQQALDENIETSSAFKAIIQWLVDHGAKQ